MSTAATLIHTKSPGKGKIVSVWRSKSDEGRIVYRKEWRNDGEGVRDEWLSWAEHEHFLLTLLADRHTSHVVDVIALHRESHAIDIVTRDAGPELERDWLSCTVINAQEQRGFHPFVEGADLLKLARACLLALDAIHAHGVVHADLKADNLCVSASVSAANDSSFAIDLDSLRLIDFAFSLQRDHRLLFVPPTDPDRLDYLPEFYREALRRAQRLDKPALLDEIWHPAIDIYALGKMLERIYRQGTLPAIRTNRAIESLISRCLWVGEKRRISRWTWPSFRKASLARVIRRDLEADLRSLGVHDPKDWTHTQHWRQCGSGNATFDAVRSETPVTPLATVSLPLADSPLDEEARTPPSVLLQAASISSQRPNSPHLAIGLLIVALAVSLLAFAWSDKWSWENRSKGVDAINSIHPPPSGQESAGVANPVNQAGLPVTAAPIAPSAPVVSAAPTAESPPPASAIETPTLPAPAKAAVPKRTPESVRNAQDIKKTRSTVPEKRQLLPAEAKPSVRRSAGEVFRDCEACPVMIGLPGGGFEMGSPAGEVGRDADEGPRRTITVVPFALSQNEVTKSQWQQFEAESGHRTPSGCHVWQGTEYRLEEYLNWKSPGFAQKGIHPVVCISWDDAQYYVRWLRRKTGRTYRLPTEAEWEFAARGGANVSAPWAVEPRGRQCDYANGADLSLRTVHPGWPTATCSDGYAYTSPVGSFPANHYGLHDMLGNVMEWTQDCWTPQLPEAKDVASLACRKKVFRGGGWDMAERFLRSAYRGRGPSGNRGNALGIRVARDLP